MNLYQGLAQRVGVLRQRLDTIHPPAREPNRDNLDPVAQKVRQLGEQLAHLKSENARLESALAELSIGSSPATPSLPPRLTAKAHRLLVQARSLLEQLKGLGIELTTHHSCDDLLNQAHRQTVALAETVLRSIQSFPEAAQDQHALCEGLDVTVSLISARVSGLTAVMNARREETERIDRLTDAMQLLLDGREASRDGIEAIAESIIADTRHGLPIRYVSPSEQPVYWAAAHGINVAQVVARIVRDEAEWRGRTRDLLVAALLHDAGMAEVPSDVLGHPAPLSDDHIRVIERHVARSVAALHRLVPHEAWLADGIRGHHERLDGTGYPAGAQGAQVTRLARLLAVADTYVSLVNSRPGQPALSTRAALTETLLEAEKGRLDTGFAEALLALGFYPVGTVVELADGRLGMVAANHPVHGGVMTPARPVVQLLTDEAGHPLPWPEHLDLAATDGRPIVKSLPAHEARGLLGDRFWQLL